MMQFLCYCCSKVYIGSSKSHLEECLNLERMEPLAVPACEETKSHTELLDESITKYLAFLKTIPVTAEDNRSPLSREDHIR